MRRITRERLKEVLHYCQNTGVFIRRITIGRWNAGEIAGSLNDQGYWLIVVDGRRYRAHHLAWLYVHGEWPDISIDHINRLTADNRIENLRIATLSENQQNRKVPKNNRSGFLGASFNKAKGKWLAQISSAGRHYFLGWYDSASDAGQSYELAKHALHKFNPQVG